MARKGLLDSVLESDAGTRQKDNRSDYAMRGASRSMKLSIDDMAESARRMAEGETILSIDPNLIDGSFVKDRMTGDDEEYEALKKSIAESGQESPVLLRPHPKNSGRYMTVFGHRRVRAARDLGLEVKAILKSMEDVAHIVAQGQENTSRADLSFIEKALFAKKLLDMDQSKETIMSALTVDATLLSRMLSVAQKVPVRIIDEIGAAKSVGRDRWEELKKLIVVPTNTRIANALVQEPVFRNADSDQRFELLLARLKGKGSRSRKTRKRPGDKRVWEAGGGRIKAAYGPAGKAYGISLTADDAAGFGEYVSSNLDQLYEAFQTENTEKK